MKFNVRLTNEALAMCTPCGGLGAQKTAGSTS